MGFFFIRNGIFGEETSKMSLESRKRVLKNKIAFSTDTICAVDFKIGSRFSISNYQTSAKSRLFVNYNIYDHSAVRGINFKDFLPDGRKK